MLSKVIYRLNAILVKIPIAFFIAIEKSLSKFLCNHKRPQQDKAFLGKRTMVEGSHYLISKIATKL